MEAVFLENFVFSFSILLAHSPYLPSRFTRFIFKPCDNSIALAAMAIFAYFFGEIYGI